MNSNKINNSTLNKMCPSCGANIVWDIDKNGFYCKYCNSIFSIEEVDKNINYNNNNNNNNNIINSHFTKIKKEDNFNSFSCGSCGAEIICDNTVTATKCIFCGNNVILSKRIENGILPDYIIPFSKNRDYIYDEFKRLGKGKILVSNKFKKLDNITEINGVYVPFWAFDFKMDGNLTIMSSEKDKYYDGEYEYIKEINYNTVFDCHFDFEKVLCDASKKIPDIITKALEPYDLTNLVSYNHSYLSGFFAENYDVMLEDCTELAKKRATNTAVNKTCSSVQRPNGFCTKNDLKIKNTNCYYILLPVWMINIDYNNKRYVFALNGDTGELVGDYPISVCKTIIVSILIFIITFLLVFGLCLLLSIIFGGLI